ncbi:MAG TPA: TetR/AcrR family transcriptional regulator [Acidimicrobiales bacterium]|nr:TetR/AcrR family transcriptional regulator [Acidimicrobiales bacterium]
MTSAVFELGPVVTGVPEPPPPALDPLLDAAARCFARHGVGRTSVQDVARELRVNRTTVYRQVGNVDAMVRLLLARELHRLLAALPTELEGRTGPEAVVEVMAAVIDFASEHPVLTKVRDDEPELIGPFVVTDLTSLLDQVTAGAAPLLRAAMDAGLLARRDPEVVAGWLARIALSLIAAPPPGPLQPFLAEIVEPVLSPGSEAA